MIYLGKKTQTNEIKVNTDETDTIKNKQWRKMKLWNEVIV